VLLKNKQLCRKPLSTNDFINADNWNKLSLVLTDRYQKILTMRLQGDSWLTIGNELNITKGSVQKAEIDILKKFEKCFPNYFEEIKKVIKKEDDGQFISRIAKRLPEFNQVSDLISKQIGKVPDENEIKDILKELLEKAELSPKQKKLSELLFELDGNVYETHQEIVNLLNIDRRNMSALKSVTMKKIIASLQNIK
jgi:DNA-directed RNA polymerase sigma subunit (sigma70/sigma32)